MQSSPTRHVEHQIRSAGAAPDRSPPDLRARWSVIVVLTALASAVAVTTVATWLVSLWFLPLAVVGAAVLFVAAVCNGSRQRPVEQGWQG